MTQTTVIKPKKAATDDPSSFPLSPSLFLWQCCRQANVRQAVWCSAHRWDSTTSLSGIEQPVWTIQQLTDGCGAAPGFGHHCLLIIGW